MEEINNKAESPQTQKKDENDFEKARKYERRQVKARLMKYNSNNSDDDSDDLQPISKFQSNYGKPPQPPSLPSIEAKPPIMIMPTVPSNSVPTVTVSTVGKKPKR